jgi:hypothetical protein
MSMSVPSATEDELIAELAHKYIWWEPIGDSAPTAERVIAQVMDIGGYDDIRRMETTLGFDRLADVMTRAAPGWISPRSWSFWRGRLARETSRAIPEKPPRRAFRDAVA